MQRILLLECGPYGQQSRGSRLAQELVERLRQRHPAAQLLERDLAREPLPALTADYAGALVARARNDDPALEVSECLIQELENSDCLVIATPMHNFTVPAALKLWIDYVLRIGRSFAATEAGKVGLLADRPTFVVVSSGGYYRGEQARQPDFLTSYLRHVLSTIGIHDLEFIHLQGLVRGQEHAESMLAQAREQVAFNPHLVAQGEAS
ncbi:NAD(P)H-dependent oxidoreductase [Pseudomonas sp. zfem001]|uniref:FMN-dependent NADH-azoreductase n=1 Tax=Pseudomonas sp. zfem001 TaxID=3078196 RepID=UPI002929FC9D|nr:NAD(P)H-dependent oxidoreductase [Pseudomonas sp. zfem001]MDU9406904.1 NAD(P)H-dependent oxidoreductase [Pseudomonas sp. zfem001]